MLCITIAKDDKWANVIGSKVIGVSKHIDYALFHWKAKDVKALKLSLSKFIFVNEAGVVDEVILADQLAARGSNFKTAKRDSHPLTEAEQQEIASAIELVRTGAVSKAEGAAAAAAAADQLSDEQQPRETTATDASASSPEGTPADSTEALADADADADADDVAPSSELAQGAASPADLATAVKPSRIANKRKRR